MRKLLTILLTCATFSAFTQVLVKETNVNIDGGKNGFEITISYADQKTAEKELKGLFKSWRGNYSDKKGVMKADDCKDKDMGENTFDVFGTVVEDGDKGSKALVAVNLGGAYLNSKEHGDRFKVMEKELHKWAVKTATDFIEDIEKEEKKKLEDQQDELSDLEKEQKKLEDEIKDYKKKIEDNKKAIEESKKNQEEKKGQIKEQETVLQGVVKKREGIK